MAPADRTEVNRVFSNLGKAIEAYERKLISGVSPFDTYVDGLRTGDPGKQAALSPAARRGLKLFVGAAHCAACHTGPAFSDGEFHNLGLPLLPGEAPDRGRAAGSRGARQHFQRGRHLQRRSDRNRRAAARNFWRRSNRSSAPSRPRPCAMSRLTAPYMHDGRFANLAAGLGVLRAGPGSQPRPSRRRARGHPQPRAAFECRQQSADLVAFLGR